MLRKFPRPRPHPQTRVRLLTQVLVYLTRCVIGGWGFGGLIFDLPFFGLSGCPSWGVVALRGIPYIYIRARGKNCSFENGVFSFVAARSTEDKNSP